MRRFTKWSRLFNLAESFESKKFSMRSFAFSYFWSSLFSLLWCFSNSLGITWGWSLRTRQRSVILAIRTSLTFVSLILDLHTTLSKFLELLNGLTLFHSIWILECQMEMVLSGNWTNDSAMNTHNQNLMITDDLFLLPLSETTLDRTKAILWMKKDLWIVQLPNLTGSLNQIHCPTSKLSFNLKIDLISIQFAAILIQSKNLWPKKNLKSL